MNPPARSISHPPPRRARFRVGLIGGSFNPAHEGHRYLSLRALKVLELDQVWWLVSPQNPLKARGEMAPYPERLELARAVARHRRIHVSDVEERMGTRYTADTLVRLAERFPAIDFVWIMGADNLDEIPRWHDWKKIFDTMPVAIFNRPTYAVRALSGEAARRFRAYRLCAGRAAALPGRRPPAWVFIWAARHPASATALRAEARLRGWLGAVDLGAVDKGEIGDTDRRHREVGSGDGRHR